MPRVMTYLIDFLQKFGLILWCQPPNGLQEFLAFEQGGGLPSQRSRRQITVHKPLDCGFFAGGIARCGNSFTHYSHGERSARSRRWEERSACSWVAAHTRRPWRKMSELPDGTSRGSIQLANTTIRRSYRPDVDWTYLPQNVDCSRRLVNSACTVVT